MNISDLNIYHLKYFTDVIRLRSFSKAAEANFISRPAISKAILRLEETIGYKLFEHEKKVVQPTKDGRRLASAIEPILTQLESAILRQGPRKQHLQIGVSYSIFKSLLRHPIDKILSEPDNFQLEIQFGTSTHLLGLLASERVDFAVLIDYQPNLAFSSRSICTGSFILACSKSNHDPQTLITTEDRPETLFLTRIYGSKPERHLKIASWTACADLIGAGKGIGLIPDFLFDKKIMKQLPLKEKIPFTVWVIWRPNTDAEVFIKMLTKK